MRVGDVVSKYESGKSGFSTISSGKGDPGGKSYGKYQLALKTGTLATFVKSSGFEDRLGTDYGSNDFDLRWKQLAEFPEFCQAQWDFIARTHYKPARQYATKQCNFPDLPSINEVIWSMSVQHGKVNKILQMAYTLCANSMTEKKLVSTLYSARRKYVQTIGLSKPLVNSLLNRYKLEEQDIYNNFGLN